MVGPSENIRMNAVLLLKPSNQADAVSTNTHRPDISIERRLPVNILVPDPGGKVGTNIDLLA